MTAKFRLVGLDCANCAAKMEKDLNALGGVMSATVNHMTEKMIIEADDDKMDEIRSMQATVRVFIRVLSTYVSQLGSTQLRTPVTTAGCPARRMMLVSL